MQMLMGRTVLVTGASRGLGAALARAFAAEGARLSLCARRAEPLERVAEEVRRGGAPCLARAVDVSDAAGVERWVEESARELGPPSVLVNNASLLGPRVPLQEISPAEWRSTLEVNLTGAFLASRAVLPHMRAAGGGSIINVSSGAAVPPRRNWGAYAVSKLALEGLTQNLAAEMEGSGIRVNSVDPGAMRTPMRAAAYPGEDPDSVKAAADAVAVFLWLAGDASRGVTGERFRADDWAAAPGREGEWPGGR